MNVHWNTLYVTTEGAYLHKDHERVVIKVERETRAEIPLLHLGAVAERLSILMEELRAPVVDRLMVSLVNRGQIGPGDLQQEETGGYRLTDAARKVVLVAYQEAKAVEVRHDFLEQNVVWGRVPHLQALLLARVLRGDVEVYPPFSIR